MLAHDDTPLPASLDRNRDFNVFWAGQTLSGLGDAFASVAMPLLVLRATGSVTRMGQLTAVTAAAYLVASLAAGALVDRVDRRRLLIACDIGRALVYSLVPLTWWLAGPSVPLLFAACAVGSVLGSLYQVACFTTVASLVPRAQLIAANGRLDAAYSAVCCVGPVLAGIACARFGPVLGIAVDAASFALSAVCVTLIRRSLAAADPTAPRGGRLAELAQSARFILGHPTLRATLALLALSVLLLGGRDALMVFRLQRELGCGEREVGMVFGVASVGSLLAAMAVARLRARWGFAACWLGAGTLLGVALAAAGRARGVGGIMALAAVMAACESIRAINSSTLRQEVTPQRMLGRVTATWWAITAVPGALGAGLNARLASAIGVGNTQVLLGALLVAVMAVGATTAVRQPAPLAGAQEPT